MGRILHAHASLAILTEVDNPRGGVDKVSSLHLKQDAAMLPVHLSSECNLR